MSNPFDPPTPAELSKMAASAAPSRLQTSLYTGLRWRYPGRSGAIAWMLIRLAQPKHPDRPKAVWTLEQRPAADIIQLRDAVKKSRESPKADAVWRDMCDVILAELSRIGLATLSVQSGRTSEDAIESDEEFNRKLARMDALKAEGIAFGGEEMLIRLRAEGHKIFLPGEATDD